MMAKFIKGQIPWNKGTGKTATCIVCKVVYGATDRKPTTKYCSNKCKYSDRTWNKQQAEKIRGRVGPWAGKKRPNVSNEQNANWKGEKVGYEALHHWVARYLGRPSKCEQCGLEDANRTKYFHWANKSHEYKRDLSDWLRLCHKCHARYDADYRKLVMKAG